jgi:hypothetical protein
LKGELKRGFSTDVLQGTPVCHYVSLDVPTCHHGALAGLKVQKRISVEIPNAHLDW